MIQIFVWFLVFVFLCFAVVIGEEIRQLFPSRKLGAFWHAKYIIEVYGKAEECVSATCGILRQGKTEISVKRRKYKKRIKQQGWRTSLGWHINHNACTANSALKYHHLSLLLLFPSAQIIATGSRWVWSSNKKMFQTSIFFASSEAKVFICAKVCTQWSWRGKTMLIIAK